MAESSLPKKRTRKNSKDPADRTETAIAVIGAGAAGCMAAVSAGMALQTAHDTKTRILLLDGNDKIGKKLYATGNGRCNLTNLKMEESCYHTGGEKGLSAFFLRTDKEEPCEAGAVHTGSMIQTALQEFGPEELIRFFEGRGIYLHDRNGYVYPRTDQAATIAEGFEKILQGLSVIWRPGEAVTSVDRVPQETGERKTGGDRERHRVRKEYCLRTLSGKTYRAKAVILACGGMAGPQFGCKGDGYRFASQFGHSIVKPLPALVALHSTDKSLRRCAGVRCDARVSLLVGRDPNWEIWDTQRGELQMTEQGISGIPVFQFSGTANRAMTMGGKTVQVRIDFLPEFTDLQWEREVELRLAQDRDCMLGTFFLGLVHRKILNWILERLGLQAEKKASKVSEEILRTIMGQMRGSIVPIDGAGGFQQAQVTAGGVPLSEVDAHFASRLSEGLYLTGELLDVDGICGGYNLQWAMSSGWIAGRAAVSFADKN